MGTVWEIKQRAILDMCADRGIYIDQSQSTNIHMIDATTSKLSSMHFHGWKLGLKTGLYYLRTKAATDAIKFTVDVEEVKQANKKIEDGAKEKEEGKLATIEEGAKEKEEAAGTVEDRNAKEAELFQKRNSTNQGSPFECVNCGS